MNSSRPEDTEIFLTLYGPKHIQEYEENEVSEESFPVTPIEAEGKTYHPHDEQQGGYR